METYFDPRQPGSLGGIETFRKHSENNLDRKGITEWLIKKDAYTLHKPIRRKFRRRRTIANFINSIWQADLNDMSSLAKYNDNFKYLLTCIDVFSKKAWAVPLKTKTGAELVQAFSSVIKDDQPIYLQTDKGTEFLNKTFQSFLKNNGIHFYTSENSDIKAAVCERFNRTLKTKMYRYFTFANTYRYIDVLPDLIYSYNNTFHRSIGTTPFSVTPENESKIRLKLYGKPRDSHNPILYRWKYNVGDKVRISKTRLTFQKGYEETWSGEIFTIVSRIKTDPVTYELADLSGEKVKGKFYEFEIQKIVKEEDDVYKIEKVLKKRKRGNKIQYLVKWKDYPSAFNSWVDDIFDV